MPLPEAASIFFAITLGLLHLHNPTTELLAADDRQPLVWQFLRIPILSMNSHAFFHFVHPHAIGGNNKQPLHKHSCCSVFAVQTQLCIS